jgi:hypothetical protein
MYESRLTPSSFQVIPSVPPVDESGASISKETATVNRRESSRNAFPTRAKPTTHKELQISAHGAQNVRGKTLKVFRSLLRLPLSRRRKAYSECSEPHSGKTHIAIVSVRIDDVCLTTHVGPTEASEADVVAALQSAVSRLQSPAAAHVLPKAA